MHTHVQSCWGRVAANKTEARDKEEKAIVCVSPITLFASHTGPLFLCPSWSHNAKIATASQLSSVVLGKTISNQCEGSFELKSHGSIFAIHFQSLTTKSTPMLVVVVR